MPTSAPPAPSEYSTPTGASDQLSTISRRPRRRTGLSMVAVVAAVVVIVTPVMGVALVTWGVLTSHHAAAQARQVNDPTLSDVDRAALDLSPSATTLFDHDAAAAVVESFDESIVGPTQFRQISLYTDYAIAVVQDIGVPTHLDQYPWGAGRVGTATQRPTPGEAEPHIDALAFTKGEVRWSAIAALAERAVELTGVEGGAVTHVIVDRSTFEADLPITIRIYVSSPSSSGFVEATASGDVIAVH